MTIDINSVNIQPSQKSEKVDRFLELLAAQIAPDKHTNHGCRQSTTDSA